MSWAGDAGQVTSTIVEIRIQTSGGFDLTSDICANSTAKLGLKPNSPNSKRNTPTAYNAMSTALTLK